jgi:hypothetical protein
MLVQLTTDQLCKLVRAEVKAALDERNEKLLDQKEAAEFLGITPEALKKRIARNLLTPDIRGGRDGVRGNRFSMKTLRRYAGHE